MAPAGKQGKAASPDVATELRALRLVVADLQNQVSLAMQVLSLVRADQLRLLADPDGPDLHRCDEGHHSVRVPSRKSPAAKRAPRRRT